MRAAHGRESGQTSRICAELVAIGGRWQLFSKQQSVHVRGTMVTRVICSPGEWQPQNNDTAWLVLT